jgi:AraC-like DNA-binding protein
MPALIRSSSLHALIELCLDQGLDHLALLKEVGLDKNTDPFAETLIPISPLIKLTQYLQSVNPDKPLSLLLAGYQGINDFGALGQLMASANTLGEAWKITARFQRMFVTDFNWPISIDPPYAKIEFSPDNFPSEELKELIEISIVQMFVILRQITGRQWQPKEVCFRHDEPTKTKAYKEFFKAPVRFNADFDGYWFLSSDLDIPLPQASPHLHATLTQYAQSQTALIDSDQTISLTKLYIKQGLPLKQYSVKYIAKQLSISERSLQRKLHEQGYRFDQLVTEVRIELSCYYLQYGNLNISQISDMTGYKNTSTFSSTFKKITGVTPSQWKKEHQRNL